MENKLLYKALAQFQQECPAIPKSKSGYGYNYAELVAIYRIIKPVMARLKIGFAQPLNGQSLKTIIFHTETNECMEFDFDLTFAFNSLEYYEKPNKNNDKTTLTLKGFEGMNVIQAASAMITYARRFCLCSFLGIVSEDDHDGSIALKNERVLLDSEIEEFGEDADGLIEYYNALNPKQKNDKKTISMFVEAINDRDKLKAFYDNIPNKKDTSIKDLFAKRLSELVPAETKTEPASKKETKKTEDAQ